MQSALRSATRRAVGVSSRHGIATTTNKAAAAAAAAANEPERNLVAENEKAWVAAMVQREVRAQMLAEEERRIARDRLRAATEETPACYFCVGLASCLVGAGLSMMLMGKVRVFVNKTGEIDGS